MSGDLWDDVGASAAEPHVPAGRGHVSADGSVDRSTFSKNKNGTVAFALDRGCCFAKRTAVEIGLGRMPLPF